MRPQTEPDLALSLAKPLIRVALSPTALRSRSWAGLAQAWQLELQLEGGSAGSIPTACETGFSRAPRGGRFARRLHPVFAWLPDF